MLGAAGVIGYHFSFCTTPQIYEQKSQHFFRFFLLPFNNITRLADIKPTIEEGRGKKSNKLCCLDESSLNE